MSILTLHHKHEKNKTNNDDDDNIKDFIRTKQTDISVHPEKNLFTYMYKIIIPSFNEAQNTYNVYNLKIKFSNLNRSHSIILDLIFL